MQDSLYMDGCVYHMVHLETLKSILHTKALLSKKKVLAGKLEWRSIANEDVQSLRDRVYIWSALENKWRALHSYVPFYFAKQTPMLYSVRSHNGWQQHDIVFLEVKRSIINDPAVVFTDGNASIQQLAKYGTECVGIRPATVKQPVCQRQYTSGTPQGTNSSCSNIYSESALLRRLNWDGIANKYWGGDQEKIRVKHAEVLVPDIVSLAKIEAISTLTQEKADEVNRLIKQYNLDGRIPGARSNPDLYF